MTIGLLWYMDDKKKSLATHLAEAAIYYEEKYGRKPDYCEVGREWVELPELPLQVVQRRYIMNKHLWLGVKD